MTARSATPSRRADPGAMPFAVALLIGVNCLVEGLLQAADHGVFATPHLRGLAYEYGAFFSPLLRGARPDYAAQPVTMFLSYALLHAGWLHLLVNMLALAGIGSEIARAAGTARFLAGYALTAIGGAACFGLLTASPVPMVGASGALFGLLGIRICWGYQERRHYGEGMRDIWRALFILVAYNLVFWLLLHGQLAWETHLGGFVAGWLLALAWGRPIYRRRRRGPDPARG
ncbi:rhomboid family intramembrane serine protease [Mangrovicoccus algicola]|uniref:Rhomboid family intramembrane serine protease n=1 Tax=Mangrovicoccus algicola TaxID=2771008 RepID=A0A8J6Z7S5_9RHOB|nr:rhomboid family intramembrane serine protease [Mangrovicoccus algicola]MBE3638045.1 rhomboid family intramembrane serine protease [Mangrovicoccus algicola]